jgi:hypothetical protein
MTQEQARCHGPGPSYAAGFAQGLPELAAAGCTAAIRMAGAYVVVIGQPELVRQRRFCHPQPLPAAGGTRAGAGGAAALRKPRRAQRGGAAAAPQGRSGALVHSPYAGQAIIARCRGQPVRSGASGSRHANPLRGVPYFQQRDSTQLSQRDRP